MTTSMVKFIDSTLYYGEESVANLKREGNISKGTLEVHVTMIDLKFRSIRPELGYPSRGQNAMRTQC